ncbi:MAG: HupE/UreJ family protein [Paracoccaceae bacterium]
MLLLVCLAFFQEYAHGLEIPQLATPWSYVAGCIVGTALLHLVGVYLGRSSEKIKFEQTYLRYAGAVSAGIGLHIILGMAGFYRRRKRIRLRGHKKTPPDPLELSAKVHFDFVSREDKNESTPTKIKK